LKLTASATAAIEAGRASFESAFTGLLNLVPQNNLRVTSTVDTSVPAGGSTSLSGALVFSLGTRGRWSAHGIAGAGGTNQGDGALVVRLRGNYQFSLFGTFPFNETDSVTIRVTDRGRAAFGVFGGGVNYALAARHGVRIDVRLVASQSRIETSVGAAPSAAALLPPTPLPSRTNPSIQFSTAAGIPSSLSGTLTEQTTFSGSGLDVRSLVTVGYVFRF
jgi:hypothetical protein